MNLETTRARLSVIASMCIFGTIGLVRRYLPLPSGFLAMARGLLGALFLCLLLRLQGKKLSRHTIRDNLVRLVFSGAMIGFNWILLFEAYRYTTVAIATLCYYMAPVFILITVPFVLQERLTTRKTLCILTALFGMTLVSGVSAGVLAPGEWRGILCGLGAAALYACVVILNKFIRYVPPMDKTIVQIGTAGAVLIPYVLLAEGLGGVRFTPTSALLLLMAGLVHTGCAYALYFSSMESLSAQSLALLSYLDPVIAILLSALVLREPMTPAQTVGAALVLCSAIVAELPERSKRHTETRT